MSPNLPRKWKKIRFQKVDINKIDDRTLIANLYGTQLIILIVALVLLLIQGRNPIALLTPINTQQAILWGIGLALAVLLANSILSRWVPEEIADDGGINEKIFKSRPIWHIALLSLVVAICEELLFRGAIQHWLGAYWTSILFATLHLRYLRHWLMTGLVFSISYGLGWIYVQSGTIWSPIAAHFLIDFVMGLVIRYQGSSRSQE
jgi:membrane protease YdiL (CAAX protease family)